MQNYINYIIGALIVLVLGIFVFNLNKTDEVSLQENNLEQNTQTETASTTQTETSQNSTSTNINNTNTKLKAKYMIKMETNKGLITLELDTNVAPKTVANFTKLAGEGFYDGVKFHRVIKDFMIQAGDPQSKDDSLVSAWGTGGPGYKFEDEILDSNGQVKSVYQNGYKAGVIAMANSGPNTNGSQFFIMHADYPLPPSYTIFGKVISGQNVVDAIANVKVGQNDRPVDAVIINKISVE